MSLLVVLLIASVAGKLSGQQLGAILIAIAVYQATMDSYISAIGTVIVVYVTRIFSSLFSGGDR